MSGGLDNNFLDNLPLMAYRSLADEARTMLAISRGCAALTGYQARDFLGSGAVAYGALILAQDQGQTAQGIQEALKEKRPYNLIYRIRTANGQERWVRDQGQAVSTAGTNVATLEGIITDHHDFMVKQRLLEQRVADRSGRLAALYDILEAAGDVAKPQSTIMRILERVLQAINVNAGAIHLLEPGAEKLQLVAHLGLPQMMLEINDTLVVAESPLVGWVVSRRSPLLIPQVQKDPRASFLAENSPYTLYAGVPIKASDQIIGVLSVLAQEESHFRAKEELNLLISVGEQIGAVVEKAKLQEDAAKLGIVEERSRLARELHDSVTQSLYSVTLFAEAGRRMIVQGDTEQAAVFLAQVGETSRQALKDMRLLVHRLRPSILAKEGFVRTIRHRLNAVEGRAGIINQFIIEGEPAFSPKLEEALYHITQEALNNALKHAAATEVAVTLRAQEGGDIDLQITDNGRGFDPNVAAETGGLGLTSMRERAEMFGGEVTCATAVGQGTTILVQFRSRPANSQDRP